MRREIKFRVWDDINKKFISLKERCIYYDIQLQQYGVWNSYGNVTGLIIQQYTGLLDKNNREIYEGDILATLSSDNKYLSEVVWVNGDGRWGFKSINLIHPERSGKTISYNLTYGCSQWRIVGNIYENPELLN